MYVMRHTEYSTKSKWRKYVFRHLDRLLFSDTRIKTNMNDYFAIEFILEEQSAVLQALNDITLILESCGCILPSSYHDPQSNSLILVWRYEKNKMNRLGMFVITYLTCCSMKKDGIW